MNNEQYDLIQMHIKSSGNNYKILSVAEALGLNDKKKKEEEPKEIEEEIDIEAIETGKKK